MVLVLKDPIVYCVFFSLNNLNILSIFKNSSFLTYFYIDLNFSGIVYYFLTP